MNRYIMISLRHICITFYFIAYLENINDTKKIVTVQQTIYIHVQVAVAAANEKDYFNEDKRTQFNAF